ncbi:MAG: type IV pilus biogenesis protein [Parcubacteria group bacterium GW2011_GWB1_45_9]|nr:MAG: type IV pilus biogenesis protein [Parcubacteria group bacterium GW2011_GWB1_45_9]
MKGFTLIELLISLGITVIVGGIGLLTIQNLRVQRTLEFESDKLVQTLREAQQNSISELESSFWGVYVNAPAGDGDRYDIFYAETIGGASTTHRSVTLPSHIEFSSPAQGNSTIINFLKISGVPDNTATFTLLTTVGDGIINISILENGNITR